MSTGTGRDTSKPESDIDYDDCFDLLSNHRRRFTLHYLKQNGTDGDLGTLSEQVAAWENGVDTEDVTYDQRKRVYTSLQQVHLPRMDQMDVVEFDQREGTVTLTEPAGELDVYLETVQGRDVSWSVFYLLLTLVNAGLVSAGALGAPLLSRISDPGWAVFVLTTFLIVSVTHLYVTRTEMRLGKTQEPPELSQ